jgi:hypothetical protein
VMGQVDGSVPKCRPVLQSKTVPSLEASVAETRGKGLVKLNLQLRYLSRDADTEPTRPN